MKDLIKHSRREVEDLWRTETEGFKMRGENEEDEEKLNLGRKKYGKLI